MKARDLVAKVRISAEPLLHLVARFLANSAYPQARSFIYLLILPLPVACDSAARDYGRVFWLQGLVGLILFLSRCSSMYIPHPPHATDGEIYLRRRERHPQ